MAKQTDQTQEFVKRYDQVLAKLEELHCQTAQQASIIGYASSSLNNIRPVWERLADQSGDDPVLELPLASGITILGGLDVELADTLEQSSNMSDHTHSIATSVQTFTANTTISSTYLGPDEVAQVSYNPCPHLKRDESAQYAARLGKLDPALERTYRQVWDTLHGTIADPERSALFAMRQVFDHLFDILAPDDEVRKSPYWTCKAEGNPDQVTRGERMEFAANTRTSAKQRAEELLASAKTAIGAYQNLNKAHERGTLNPVAARNAVMAMDQIVRDWVDGLQL